MLLTLEKVLILGSVGMFAGLSGETLSEIAAAVEEVEVEAGGAIAGKGEFGSNLFVVAQGKVRIHDGETELAVRGEREAFGVRLALDPGEHAASATAVEDSLLLKLEHDALFELLTEDVELAKNVIRSLCRMLRGRIEDLPDQSAQRT
jgi:CRP-like cAMP-binding protein